MQDAGDSYVSLELSRQLVEQRGEIEKLKVRIADLSKAPSSATSLDMTTQDDRALTDQKIAASEARSETKMARLEGKLDLVIQSIGVMTSELQAQRADAVAQRAESAASSLAQRSETAASFIALKAEMAASALAQRQEASTNRTAVLSAIVAAVIALAGLGYAALSYGATNFYNGTVVRDIAHNEAVAQHATQPAAK